MTHGGLQRLRGLQAHRSPDMLATRLGGPCATGLPSSFSWSNIIQMWLRRFGEYRVVSEPSRARTESKVWGNEPITVSCIRNRVVSWISRVIRRGKDSAEARRRDTRVEHGNEVPVASDGSMSPSMLAGPAGTRRYLSSLSLCCTDPCPRPASRPYRARSAASRRDRRRRRLRLVQVAG